MQDRYRAEIALTRQWAEAAFSLAGAGGLPFSFVYGGKPSAELLAGWAGTLSVEERGAVSCRTVTFIDPHTRLEVRAVCTVYLDTPGVDWTIHFTNRGGQDSPVLEQVQALDAADEVGPAAPVVLHRLNGSMCLVDDWMPFDQAVPAGGRVDFSTTLGRSANASPWFNLDWGGGGLVTAVGWSGQWQASAEYRGGQVRVRAGLQNLHTVLHPGESLRSPRILQLRWQGADPDQACNAFRQTMLAHILPRTAGELILPPVVHLSTAFYELNASDENNVLAHLRSTRGLGFEMFWLDAYWTGPGGFPDCMGNYGFPLERVESAERFPHGMRAVGEAVKAEGLGYVMWFEPERVAPGTFLAREHPEWVISPAGDGSGLYNLGLPEARQYMTSYLNAVIQAYQLACLRIDYNIDPLPYWQYLDARDPQRVGMAETRYVAGLYQMWDDLLRANPGLFIDNCASGGRRIDLETMSRSIPLWRSDNTCDMLDLKPATIDLAALKNQLMSAGLNRYVPFSTCGQMGASPYHFRSGFNAGIAFCEDIRPEGYPRGLLRQGIAEGKRLRKYFTGNFYPLAVPGADPAGWCVMQYHRPAQDDGMLLAFRRDQAPADGWECSLREIDPAASYTLSIYRAYDLAETVTLSGAELGRLWVSTAERPGSVLIEYARTPGDPGQAA
jgi:alpha-galactosidase